MFKTLKMMPITNYRFTTSVDRTKVRAILKRQCYPRGKSKSTYEVKEIHSICDITHYSLF